MLLDTSGLFALDHRAERFHATAQAAFYGASTRLTHSYVLAEFVALVAARGAPRDAGLRFLEALIMNPDIETVWVDEALNNLAMTLLFQRPDKACSLCDAVSFVLMHDRALLDALTTDRHFEQEGFRRLLA